MSGDGEGGKDGGSASGGSGEYIARVKLALVGASVTAVFERQVSEAAQICCICDVTGIYAGGKRDGVKTLSSLYRECDLEVRDMLRHALHSGRPIRCVIVHDTIKMLMKAPKPSLNVSARPKKGMRRMGQAKREWIPASNGFVVVYLIYQRLKVR